MNSFQGLTAFLSPTKKGATKRCEPFVEHSQPLSTKQIHEKEGVEVYIHNLFDSSVVQGEANQGMVPSVKDTRLQKSPNNTVDKENHVTPFASGLAKDVKKRNWPSIKTPTVIRSWTGIQQIPILRKIEIDDCLPTEALSSVPEVYGSSPSVEVYTTCSVGHV